jgi:hypothetical protein
MKITTEMYVYTETLEGFQLLKLFDDGDLMTSESSGTDFGTRVYKFFADTIKVVVMVISALEDQRVTSILKMFAFTYSGIF